MVCQRRSEETEQAAFQIAHPVELEIDHGRHLRWLGMGVFLGAAAASFEATRVAAVQPKTAFRVTRALWIISWQTVLVAVQHVPWYAYPVCDRLCSSQISHMGEASNV